MKTTNFIIMALAVTLAASCKKDKNESTINDTDEVFLKNAAAANFNEIDAGNLAATKATDASVKSFGSMMATEHQTALNELKDLAGDKKVSIPEGPDATHVALKQQLMQMYGRTFDSTYIHLQVTDHQATINLFNKEIAEGKDEDVKNYANKYLPHIRMHFNWADTTSNRF